MNKKQLEAQLGEQMRQLRTLNISVRETIMAINAAYGAGSVVNYRDEHWHKVFKGYSTDEIGSLIDALALLPDGKSDEEYWHKSEKPNQNN